jgi:hypothetical protein
MYLLLKLSAVGGWERKHEYFTPEVDVPNARHMRATGGDVHTRLTDQWRLVQTGRQRESTVRFMVL